MGTRGEPKATQRADDVEDDLVVNFHALALWPVRFDCGHRGVDRPQRRAHLHCGLAAGVTRDGRLRLEPNRRATGSSVAVAARAYVLRMRRRVLVLRLPVGPRLRA